MWFIRTGGRGWVWGVRHRQADCCVSDIIFLHTECAPRLPLMQHRTWARTWTTGESASGAKRLIGASMKHVYRRSCHLLSHVVGRSCVGH